MWKYSTTAGNSQKAADTSPRAATPSSWSCALTVCGAPCATGCTTPRRRPSTSGATRPSRSRWWHATTTSSRSGMSACWRRHTGSTSPHARDLAVLDYQFGEFGGVTSTSDEDRNKVKMWMCVRLHGSAAVWEVGARDKWQRGIICVNARCVAVFRGHMRTRSSSACERSVR